MAKMSSAHRLHVARRFPSIAFLLATVVTLAGCSDLPRPGTTAEAEAIAGDWLEAVSGGAADRGWELLHPLTQQRLFDDDRTRYVTMVHAIEWRDFRWDIDPPTRLDGNYRVSLVLLGEPSPARLLADGRLIQLLTSDDGVTRGVVTVLIDWDGARGILGP